MRVEQRREAVALREGEEPVPVQSGVDARANPIGRLRIERAARAVEQEERFPIVVRAEVNPRTVHGLSPPRAEG